MATAEPKSPLTRMPAQEFVRRLKDEDGEHDVNYAFWLGAGCSITSGIPGAASLVKDHWLPKLCKLRGGDPSDLDGWAASNVEGYDPTDPAAVYGPVMERLFLQPGARQREVERLCSRGKPGFGYAVLAALLSRDDGMFNVALTTNFDELIADAMYVFSLDDTRPLIIPDEALARYIRPTRTRPLVVKVHGDFRLSPQNTTEETEVLKPRISEGIGDLLHDRGAIFVGYGGNDKGIAEVFKALPDEALPHGIWWASREEPQGVLRAWLERRGAVWVEVPGFDELMLLFKSEFEIPNPNSAKFDQMFANFISTYEQLQLDVEKIPASDPSASSLKDAAERAGSFSTDWTASFFSASRLQRADPDRAERVFLDGISQFPQAAQLQSGLALLLLRQGRYKEGLDHAQGAFELEPSTKWVAEIYSGALAINGRIPEALECLRVVVDREPDSAEFRSRLGCYLVFSGDIKGAEEQLRAIEEECTVIWDRSGLYPSLLAELGRQQEAAEAFTRSVTADPDDYSGRVNFVRTLIALSRREDALEQLTLAFESLPPGNAVDRLEAHFYRWVVASEETKAESLKEIRRLTSSGVSYPNWPMTDAVRFVRESGDPDADWAEKLADVVGGRRDASVLKGWDRWQAA